MSASNPKIPSPATSDICSFRILVDGKEIPTEFQLISLSVSLYLNKIPSATLQFSDGDPSGSTFPISNSEYFIPGKKIEIKLGYNAKDETVFNGIVTGHRIKIDVNESMLLIECRDEAIKMTQSERRKTSNGKNEKEIMKEILESYSFLKEIEATTPFLSEIVPSDESDWDFIIRKAKASLQVTRIVNGNIVIAKPDFEQQPVIRAEFGDSIVEFDAQIAYRWQSEGVESKPGGRVKFNGTSLVWPGKMIQLSGIGERFEGNVYVSGVNHTVSNGDWFTEVQFGFNH